MMMKRLSFDDDDDDEGDDGDDDDDEGDDGDDQGDFKRAKVDDSLKGRWWKFIGNWNKASQTPLGNENPETIRIIFIICY